MIREIIENLVYLPSAELLAAAEGELKRRTLDVAHLYIGVVRVDARTLRSGLEEPFWALREELVERVGRRHHNSGRNGAAPAGAPYLLPSRRDAARIAVKHRKAERAHVDAELQRVRAHYAAQLAAAQVALYLPALLRQIAAAVAHDHRRVGAGLFETLPYRFEKQLYVEARAREYYRAYAAGERSRRYLRRLKERRASYARVPVDDRRIVNDHFLLRSRRAALRYQRHFAPYQRARVLLGVRYRRGAADERRARAVELADPREAREKIRQVRAEDAPVSVKLVDDDER